MTQGFVFVNVGATLIIIIVLLATTGRANMHPASYVFGNVTNREPTAFDSAILHKQLNDRRECHQNPVGRAMVWPSCSVSFPFSGP